MALVAGTLGLMCRSFISIIVPLLENGHNLWNSPKCRSFISIIVPERTLEEIFAARSVSILYKYHSSLTAIGKLWISTKIVSILYKYHSSHSLNTNKVEGAQVSILYKYHSSRTLCPYGRVFC